MRLQLVFISLLYLSFCACVINQASSDENKDSLLGNSSAASNIILQEDQTTKTPLRRDIRLIDFKNFTYNWFPKYGDVIIKKKIVLRNGRNEEVEISGPGIHPLGDSYREFLADVSYADLTGNGIEEAVVTVGVDFYRSPNRCIFIFGENDGKALLLWQYETNTADRNLDWRGHKIIHGNLVIEEYDTKFGDPPICCPLRYFRKTFAWNGKSFEEIKVEIIQYDKQSREFTGYPSDSN